MAPVTHQTGRVIIPPPAGFASPSVSITSTPIWCGRIVTWPVASAGRTLSTSTDVR